MFRLVILMLLFSSCVSTESKIYNFDQYNSPIQLPVVEKKLINEKLLSEDFKFYFSDTLNKNFKLDGFEGIVFITIISYSEILKNLNNSKEIQINIELEIKIKKDNSQQKVIINASQNGKITGNFSISEFDELINKTQIKLVNKIMNEINNQF